MKNFGSLLKLFPKKNILLSRSLYNPSSKFFSEKNEKITIDEKDSHEDFKPKAKIPTQETNFDEIFKTIDQIIKENKVVLFMKGSPQYPMCGFSNFVVEVLKYYSNKLLRLKLINIFKSEIQDYKSVDILLDPVLREAVKKYTNWSTYPQLYINGKFIGGCDIVTDMHKEGTLKTLFAENGLTPNK